MDKPLKILIVEDEMIIAANISLHLTKLGYEVTGILSRGEEVVHHLQTHHPDLMLLDIQLKGELDGIQTANLVVGRFNIAIIYLTSNTDAAHFERAKETHPFAFLSKPYKKLDLQRAIELAATHMPVTTAISYSDQSPAQVLQDCIFVKYNKNMVKVSIADILYVEAERNYCRIHCLSKEYLLVMTLKEMNQKLPSKFFFRLHRSYIVNITKIREVSLGHVVVSGKVLPLAKELRSDLLARIPTI
jgi:DNA-binding LytR/AlgR family response regulator